MAATPSGPTDGPFGADQREGMPSGVLGGNSVSICQLVESAAAANGLPFEFFARVIWQESRFRSDAIGPMTRSGAQAQGIAQFMPLTAAERLVRNPLDPAQALPKSAEFLRDLRSKFGNLGLAAAAYNAGPGRVGSRCRSRIQRTSGRAGWAASAFFWGCAGSCSTLAR
jgi:soluble lytic murein transglycosylase-like protein